MAKLIRAIRSMTTSAIGVVLMSVSSVSVVAQDPQAGPAELTATWAFGPQVSSESTEVVDGVIRMRDGVWQPSIIETSDPRLDGTLMIIANHDVHGGVGGPEVWFGAFRIENDEGAWRGIPSFGLTFPDGTGAGGTSVLNGEGAYRGLFAIADVSLTDGVWDVHGFILDGDPPPDPVAAATE